MPFQVAAFKTAIGGRPASEKISISRQRLQPGSVASTT
jgi:hypothetical protein